MRVRYGVRAAIVPPLASLALLPFVVAGALWAYAQPLPELGGWSAVVEHGTVGPTVAGVACSWVLAAFGWAAYVASPPGRRRVDVTLRALAVFAIVGGAALVSWGVLRSRRSPDADAWAASLPRVSSPPQALESLVVDRLGRSTYDVRHDEARDLWVVTQAEAGGDGRIPALVLGCALVPREVAPRDLTGLAPPRAWVLEAAGGVVAGLASVAVALAVARRYRRRRAGVLAEHVGGGWVARDGGSAPLHVPALDASAPGPVVVGLGPSSLPTYRDAGTPGSVRLLVVGTHEDVEDTARSIASVGYAAALAIVLLACAPLAVV